MLKIGRDSEYNLIEMPTLTTEKSLLTRGQIHVWRVNASLPAPGDELSPGERVRAERRIGAARQEFVASHLAMRRLAASYLDVEPDEVRLDCPDGKPPRLRGSEIEVSLSHREGVALVALGLDPIGVDVEEARAFPDEEVSDVAAFIFAANELRQFEAFPDSARCLALARAWTRKESVMKALGCGFGDISIACIEMHPVAPSRFLATTPDGTSVHVIDLDVDDGFVGAVATTGDISELLVRDFEERSQ